MKFAPALPYVSARGRFEPPSRLNRVAGQNARFAPAQTARLRISALVSYGMLSFFSPSYVLGQIGWLLRDREFWYGGGAAVLRPGGAPRGQPTGSGEAELSAAAYV